MLSIYVRKPILSILGDALGKISPYVGKVNVPCKKCHGLVRVGISEKLMVCPICSSKW